MRAHNVKTIAGTVVSDPPFARFLFSDTRSAGLWTVIRVLLGLSWLQSGIGKLGNPAWMQTGEALQGFWARAVAIPDTGSPLIKFDWYRSFIQGMLDNQSYVWFAKLVAFGETLIGVALIVGAFVGIAAFFAAFMNWNFVMAGSASSNGLFIVAALLLVVAWKVAGYYGLDYFLLRRLGTPWGVRKVSTEHEESSPAPSLA
jgi:thiosulfate dehydrogenase [quinone] large subunit